jgi:hypothetical protein
MADVTFQHSEYVNAVPDWTMVDDVCAGDRKVKAAGARYLPIPNPLDTSAENEARYEQYKARAVFYNATGRTLQGLIGAVSRKNPAEKIPPVLEYIKTDIDGAGVSLYQQSQSVLGAVLKKGRNGLLVDYPHTERPASVADQTAGLIRASIISIDATQIINWRSTKIGGVHRLSLVVIKEVSEIETNDGFGVKCVDQYRVLKLVDGVYTVEIWEKAGDDWAVSATYQPENAAGKKWAVIPFTFVGAENNDKAVDQSPLYDLAVVNIAHYRNSADYEDSAFLVGQAQPWMSGLDEEWRDHLEEKGVAIGSRTPILLPENGAFGIEQAEPNTMVKEAMDQKERQMVALGARLVERGQAVKTATEAQGEIEAEHSVLSLAAKNVGEAYTVAIQWMAEFMGGSGSVLFEPNTDFIEQELTAPMLTALVGAWQSGRLPSSDFWEQMRKYGVIDPDKQDEAIKTELDEELPGLGLDDGGE